MRLALGDMVVNEDTQTRADLDETTFTDKVNADMLAFFKTLYGELRKNGLAKKLIAIAKSSVTAKEKANAVIKGELALMPTALITADVRHPEQPPGDRTHPARPAVPIRRARRAALRALRRVLHARSEHRRAPDLDATAQEAGGPPQ